MKNYALPTILVFVLLGLFLGVMPSLAQERQKKKLKKKRARAERLSLNINNPHGFIDGHVHLNDLNMQLELMKKNRIARAIAFWGRNSTNESLIESFRDHPQKLIPFVSVSPERNKYRVLWKQNDPKLLAILEAQLKTGVFKGIGEISVTHFPGMGFPEADFSPNSTLMKGIMRLAEKYKVPVTIHCEVTRIREFSELLYEFKIVKVIWAHGGYTPYFLANRMLEKHPNLIYELSARTWLDHPRSSDYTIFKSNSEVWKQWLDLVEANPRRFIVGTDSSNHSAERDQRKIESVQLFLGLLTPETRTRVAQENLLELVQ
ncbi:MAG: amidohydrolase family protein [Pyrinomonadaceae bacterium]|nr:amidohydrolase family protein [Pyrinomonadaceae bacterium]